MSSTHLYLPPGVIGTISSSSDVIVQIGSHDTSLLDRTGSWKRWPVVTMSVQVSQQPLEVASPFGGIVYIGGAVTNDTTVMFYNFSRYPRYSVREDSWFNTMDIQVPWGEIELKHLILTLPTQIMLYFQDRMKENFELIDDILSEAHRFIGVREGSCKRVVFDVDLLTDEPEIGELSIFNVDDLPFAIDSSQYSIQFVMSLALIVMAAIPNDILDPDAVSALATVSVYQSCQKMMRCSFPQEVNYPGKSKELFEQMWELAQERPKHFSDACERFLSQKFSPDIPMNERWNSFMDMLNEPEPFGNASFSLKNTPSFLKLSDRFKMTSFLSISSSDLLQEYQMISVLPEES